MLKEIVQKYPQSAAAAKAKAKLVELAPPPRSKPKKPARPRRSGSVGNSRLAPLGRWVFR